MIYHLKMLAMESQREKPDTTTNRAINEKSRAHVVA